MAGRIPKAFIADLLNRIDIVDIVDSRVPLKKTGSNYAACCPFHQEKSPSFTVSPIKQFYHCFGCGAHGSAISFLMEYDRMEYVEAIEALASQAGLVVPYEQGNAPIANKIAPDLYQYLQQAAQYYQTQLPHSERAQHYLQKRGLSEQIIHRYGLGYAPAGWGNLSDQFTADVQPLLEKTGLVIKNKLGRYHDRFRDRIMFPIRDQRGRVMGFGGRIIDVAAGEEQPKYLNSPETPVFHKGSALYGLYEALQAKRELKRAIIVEGYMDVIALAQYGIDYAMATMGTAATRQHLERLFRHTATVVFCFDGDNAGKAAARRALETVLPLMEDGRQVRFMFLPDEHDPDSLVRAEGTDGFLSRMEAAQGIGEYCFGLLQEQVDMTSLDGRASLTKLAAGLFEAIPAGAFREMMLAELARRSRLAPDNVSHLVKSAPTSQHTLMQPRATQRDSRPTPMRLVIALLLQQPDFIQFIPTEQNFATLNIPGASILQQVVSLLREQPTLTTATLLEFWRDTPEYTQVSKLAAMSFAAPENGLAAEFAGAITQLADMGQDQSIEQLLQKAASSGLTEAEKLLLQSMIKESKKSK
jgi:DNA primase